MMYSSRIVVEDACYGRYAAAYCRESRAPVEAAASEEWEAI